MLRHKAKEETFFETCIIGGKYRPCPEHYFFERSTLSFVDESMMLEIVIPKRRLVFPSLFG